MIDQPLAQPGQPRRRPRRGMMSLLALLLLAAILGFVVLQGLRRCSDLAGSGQLLWGDLRPLALPFVFFVVGILLLGFRGLLLLRSQWRLANVPQVFQESAQNRHFILLSLAILALFFGVIFTCSQLALMGYPPCSLEVAINPISTADYGPWSTDLFQPLDPKIMTQIAIDAAGDVELVPAANRPPLNITVGVNQVVQATLPPEAVLATATAEAIAAVPTAQAAQTQTTVAQTAVLATAEALLTTTATLEATATITGTLSATPTGTLSATPTATATGTLSATPTGTLSATPTATVTGTLSATPTGTLSATPTATVTGTLSATPTGTLSATPTLTVTGTLSVTPLLTTTSQTATATLTGTLTSTATFTHTPTFTNTAISTATLIPTVFVVPTSVPLVPIPTSIPPTSTRTPTLTFTPLITNTPTNTLTPSMTYTPTDTFTPTYTLTPSATNTPFGLGNIYREYWMGVNGSTVLNLTGSGNYPNSPNNCDLLPSFDAPINWADNYGTRMRGYLYPPTTGLYTFWIASDDNGELWLSSDMSPTNRLLIATVPGWTNHQQWTKYPAQQSAAIMLTAGQGYYIDALQKEAAGLDNISVAWQGPGISQTVISGGFLAPFATTCTVIPFVPTPTYTPIPTNTPTFTPSPTPTLTPSFTPTWTLSPSADVYVTMSVSNPTPNVGDTIQYNITYGNLGASTATGVQMLSPLPVQVSYVSHTGGTFDSATGNWTLMDLLSGQNGNASITVVVQAGASGSTVPNSIVIMAAQADPNPGNNNTSTSITVP